MNNYQGLGLKLKLQELIDSLEEKTFKSFKTKLLDLTTNIYIKEWNESSLFMITNNFTKNTSNLTELERECRSVILDSKTLDIICYSYDDIYYNQDAKDYIIKNNDFSRTIQECFEGTLLSIFYYNDKWNVATRRCIDAKKSSWNNNKSHFDMFLECINTSFNEFTSYLKEENNYFFVLVHNQNKHIVDYTEFFQDNDYKKIIHVMTRRRSDHCEIDLEDNTQWNKLPTFITPKKLGTDDDYSFDGETKKVSNFINIDQGELEINKIQNMKDFSKLDMVNKKNKLDLPVKSEGLLVKVLDPSSNKLVILKFQTNSFQFMSMLKPNTNNIYMSFIELYQNDMLKRHLEYFPGNSKFDNSSNDEIYDTIGIIDAAFKVQTSELFELFRTLYNLRDCSHKNEDLYNILPTEYTIALYRIRGIYYKKKEKFIKSKQMETETNVNSPQINTGLRIFDIYNMLKYTYDTKDLLKLLRARKILLHKCVTEDNLNYPKIINLSHRCDKVSIKMMAILLNNMFPKDPNLDIQSKFIDDEEQVNENNIDDNISDDDISVNTEVK